MMDREDGYWDACMVWSFACTVKYMLHALHQLMFEINEIRLGYTWRYLHCSLDCSIPGATPYTRGLPVATVRGTGTTILKAPYVVNTLMPLSKRPTQKDGDQAWNYGPSSVHRTSRNQSPPGPYAYTKGYARTNGQRDADSLGFIWWDPLKHETAIIALGYTLSHVACEYVHVHAWEGLSPCIYMHCSLELCINAYVSADGVVA